MIQDWVDSLGLGIVLTFAVVLSGLIGAFIGQVIESVYKELISKRIARESFEKELDPILKSLDELTGKLTDLAKRDFRNHKNNNLERPARHNLVDSQDFASVVYLFGIFWAHVEILKLRGVLVHLMRYKQGAKLHNFLNCLESRAIRIVSRLQQRAIGEVFIVHANGNYRVKPFIEVAAEYRDSAEFRMWLEPLVRMLERSRFKKPRQRFLVYGTVCTALLDTLDSRHKVTKPRPPQVNKLEEGSRNLLRRKIFRHYLKGIRGNQKYWKLEKVRTRRVME